MKKWLSLFGALLFSGVTFAQTTIVVGVATDSDSTLWTNGTVSAQFVPNPSQPNLNVYRINGAPLSSAVIMQGPISLGSGGNFSITVYDNTQVTPSGSEWQFTVCPNAISKCGSVTTSVSGSGQSITTLIDAAIPAPRFPAVAGSYGYADVEGILSTPVGGTYWNVIHSCQRYYDGSSWNCGSLLSGCVVGGAIPISCGGTGATTAAGALANLGGLPLSGGTLTGALNGTSASFSGNIAATGSVTGSNMAAGTPLATPIASILAPIVSENGTALDTGGSQSTSYGYMPFGDSFSVSGGVTTNAQAYTGQIATDIVFGPYNNKGVGGDDAADMIYRVLSAASTGDTGNPLFTSMIGVNDAAHYGVVTNAQAAFTEFAGGANAWLAMSGTNKVFVSNATYVTRGGTWTADSTFAMAPGLTTSASSATLTDSTCTVGSNGTLYVWFYLYVSSTGKWHLSVDGTTLTDTISGASSLSSQILALAPINTGTTSAGLARYTGISQGTHTCAITTDAEGSSGFIAFGFSPAHRYRGSSAPAVYMGGVSYQKNDANSSTTASFNNYAQAIAGMLYGDGLNLKFVDIRSALDYNLDFSSTAMQNCPASTGPGLHPNICGHTHIAHAFEDAIKPGTVGWPVNVTVRVANGNDTMTASDQIVLQTMPSASENLPSINIKTGQVFEVKNVTGSTGTITLYAGGSATFADYAGATFIVLPPYADVSFTYYSSTNTWLQRGNSTKQFVALRVSSDTADPMSGQDQLVIQTAASATETLPPSGSVGNGQVVTIKALANPITIAANTGQTLDAGFTNPLPAYQSVSFVFYAGGPSWFVYTGQSNPYTYQKCTTVSITPSTSAGGTATGTCTIGTWATGHAGNAAATDGTVQGIVIPQVSVSATTATVTLTTVIAGSPTAKSYNVTVF